MAKNKKETDSFTDSLIESLNAEMGDRVAYNLMSDSTPTHVKRWLSTGSRFLDYIVSNMRTGGLPEGRIVEIFGDPGLGKSHIAAQICKSAQRMGGIAVYIDAENAISPENLASLGVNIARGFVYVHENCTEHVMSVAEKTIIKARALQKDVPVVIVWDSVAGSSPKAELEGEYDDNTIGLQARVISKGMRKITSVIGENNVLFVILNQTRSKIGVMYGDPTTTSGGKAIPFHASVRIKLTGGAQIKVKEEVVGIEVHAKTIKNRLSPPFRSATFNIIFGVGIEEHGALFDLLEEHGPIVTDREIMWVGGDKTWKKLLVLSRDVWDLDRDFVNPKKKKEYVWPSKEDFTKKQIDEKSVLSRSFNKAGFKALLEDKDAKVYLDQMLDDALIRVMNREPDIDPESLVEMEALTEGLEEVED